MIITVFCKTISVPIWRCAKCRNECLKTQYWNIGNDADQRTRTHSNCSVSSCERIYQIFFPGVLQGPISFSSYPLLYSPLLSSSLLSYTNTLTLSYNVLDDQILMIEIYQELSKNFSENVYYFIKNCHTITIHSYLLYMRELIKQTRNLLTL